MKIWDTETGTCKAKFTTGKTPHVVRYYPLDNHQFVAGMADKKIVQFDIRSGEMVQEYGMKSRVQTLNRTLLLLGPIFITFN